MERIELKYQDAKRSIDSFGDILNESFTIIVRDATIQRFEYSFEALWKYIKEYIKVKEGIVCNSPKSCFRELFSLKIVNEEETVQCLEMTDKRNETSHTYKEELAQIIYENCNSFYILMKNLLECMQP